MTVALSALPQFFDNAGNPLSGGKVFTYASGTLNPLATYTDRGGGTPNANPVILDAAGRADIWLSTNIAYKLRVEDSGGTVMDSVDQFYAGADPTQLVAAGIVPATGGDYTGPVNFNGGALFNGTAAQDLATLDSLGIAAVQNANLWVNSDFAINQRVATTAADGSLGPDRAVILCDGGSVTLSQLAQPADGIPYAMRMTQPDAGPKRIGCVQISEAKDCLAYRGKNLVFAPKVRCSIGTTVRVALVAWTGTLDAPTRDVVNSWTSTTYTAGNFFIANTLPIAVGAVAVTAATWTDVPVSSASAGGVVVPSTLNNLYMVMWTDVAVAQNVTLDMSVVRCGQGTNVPLWTPPDAAVEILRCQRDYAKSYAIGTTPGTGTAPGRYWASGNVSGSILGFLQFPVSMRSNPTVTLWDGNGNINSVVSFAAGGAFTTRAATANNITEKGFEIGAAVGTDVVITGQWAAATGF